MARHILIVEKSDALRRELQAKIMGILDDVIISETATAEQALDILGRSTVHLLLYGLEKGDTEAGDLIGKLRKENALAPLLLLVHDLSIDLQPFVSLRVDYLEMPCSARDLGAAVDNICNPICLRKDKRYSIPGATGEIEQGVQRYEITVLNISEGGVLCDFKIDRYFNSLEPVMMSVTLPLDGRVLYAEKLYSITSSLKVIERNSDFTPLLVRFGFKFIVVPGEAKEVFRDLRLYLSSKKQGT